MDWVLNNQSISDKSRIKTKPRKKDRNKKQIIIMFYRKNFIFKRNHRANVKIRSHKEFFSRRIFIKYLLINIKKLTCQESKFLIKSLKNYNLKCFDSKFLR